MDLSEAPPATRTNRRESFIPDQTASHEAPVDVPVPKISQKEILKKRLQEDREKKQMQDQTALTQPIIVAPPIIAKERTATPIKARHVAGTLTLNDDDAQSVLLTPAQESKALRESERKEAREQSDLLQQVIAQSPSGPSGFGKVVSVPVDISKADKMTSHPFGSLVPPKRRQSATLSGLPVPSELPTAKQKRGVGRPSNQSKIDSAIVLG